MLQSPNFEPSVTDTYHPFPRHNSGYRPMPVSTGHTASSWTPHISSPSPLKPEVPAVPVIPSPMDSICHRTEIIRDAKISTMSPNEIKNSNLETANHMEGIAREMVAHREEESESSHSGDPTYNLPPSLFNPLYSSNNSDNQEQK